MCGKKVQEQKIKKIIVDFGLVTPFKGTRLYAAVKGLKDSGLEINCPEEMFPSDDRVQGKNIEEYANKLKEDAKKYEKQFSAYLKNGIKPEELTKTVEGIKNKIIGK